MDSAEIERYLHAHIPLSQALGVRVGGADDARVVLTAPLAPNINHRETAFGGSVSALAILSAWTLLYVRLHREVPRPRIVIQENTVQYLRPIAADFSAECRWQEAEIWNRFVATLARRGRARIAVEAAVHCQGATAAQFHGVFVALT